MADAVIGGSCDKAHNSSHFLGDQTTFVVSFVLMKPLLPIPMKLLTRWFSASYFVKAFSLCSVFMLTVSASATPASILLMQNPDSAQTIVSTDMTEVRNLLQAGWKLTASGLLAAQGGSDTGMLHRMLKASPNDVQRRLAATPEEFAANLAAGFVSEAAMGYVVLKEAPGLVAIHAFSKGDRRIWVSGQHEQYWADQNGWKREGVAFWLRPAPAR